MADKVTHELLRLERRVRELETCLARALDAQALDGYEELEAEANVLLGRWEPDGDGGYRLLAAGEGDA